MEKLIGIGLAGIAGYLGKGALVACLALLTGCSGSTGWQVGFGVYPVTQLQNQQSLTAAPKVVRVRDTRDE